MRCYLAEEEDKPKYRTNVQRKISVSHNNVYQIITVTQRDLTFSLQIFTRNQRLSTDFNGPTNCLVTSSLQKC